MKPQKAKLISSAVTGRLFALTLLVSAMSQLQGPTQSSAAGDDNEALAQVVAKGDTILLHKYGYKPYKGQGPVYGLSVNSGGGSSLTIGAGDIAVAVYSSNDCVSAASAQIGYNGPIIQAEMQDGFPLFRFNYPDNSHKSGDVVASLTTEGPCRVQYRYYSK
jgi:hypothetical protein